MQQILVGSGGAAALVYSVEYFALGGGGGGANISKGGGGSGQVPSTGTFSPTAGSSFVITIGNGGTAGNNGSPTSIANVVTASGGQTPGPPNGTRYGANNNTYSGGINGSSSGGGGAGAGGNAPPGGVPNFQYGGDGGIGVSVNIGYTTIMVGGGGGGEGFRAGYRDGTGTDGGGSRPPSNPIAGYGGGGWTQNSGGSGKVVLTYSDSFPPLTTIYSGVNVFVIGGYRYYEIDASGTIVF